MVGRLGFFVSWLALQLVHVAEAVPGAAVFVTGEDYIGAQPVPLGPDFTIEGWIFVTNANTGVFGEVRLDFVAFLPRIKKRNSMQSLLFDFGDPFGGSSRISIGLNGAEVTLFVIWG
jgi:hypothetical protein